jgi:hypothetical protein
VGFWVITRRRMVIIYMENYMLQKRTGTQTLGFVTDFWLTTLWRMSTRTKCLLLQKVIITNSKVNRIARLLEEYLEVQRKAEG